MNSQVSFRKHYSGGVLLRAAAAAVIATPCPMPLLAQENNTYLSGIKENARVHIKKGKRTTSLAGLGGAVGGGAAVTYSSVRMKCAVLPFFLMD